MRHIYEAKLDVESHIYDFGRRIFSSNVKFWRHRNFTIVWHKGIQNLFFLSPIKQSFIRFLAYLCPSRSLQKLRIAFSSKESLLKVQFFLVLINSIPFNLPNPARLIAWKTLSLMHMQVIKWMQIPYLDACQVLWCHLLCQLCSDLGERLKIFLILHCGKNYWHVFKVTILFVFAKLVVSKFLRISSIFSKMY